MTKHPDDFFTDHVFLLHTLGLVLTSCPICQRSLPPRTILPCPYMSPAMLELAEKRNPAWREGDGLCKSCFDSLVKESGETHPTTSDVADFREHYRCVLTMEESARWERDVSETSDWRREQIVERVAAEAMVYGYDAWLIFGSDEALLARGDEESNRGDPDFD